MAHTRPKPAMTDNLCFLNGETLPLSQARIPVLDRGFIFGDGIYDVVPVYGKRLFRFDEHLARLSRSLVKVRINNPYARDEWLAHCRALVAARPEADQVVYIQVTRGVAPRDHVMPQGVAPTVFMMNNAMRPPSAEQRHRGVACTTARDFRWERGDIKSTSLLGNVLARQISADHGTLETIMFRDGWLTEAAASNVWVCTKARCWAHPKATTCWKASVWNCCASCATTLASPTTCDPSLKPTCAPPTRCCSARPPKKCFLSPASTVSRWAMARCAASPARFTPVCTKPTNAPRRRCRFDTCKFMASPPKPQPAPSLIDYPCAFPIKVMGAHRPGFEEAMVVIARQFDAAFDARTVERRPSKAGTYLGLTLTVTATSREQLDELYRTLSTHPLVKVVL